MFLGNPRFQKGYRFYQPNTRRFFASSNVTFYTDVPYNSHTKSTFDKDKTAYAQYVLQLLV